MPPEVPKYSGFQTILENHAQKRLLHRTTIATRENYNIRVFSYISLRDNTQKPRWKIIILHTVSYAFQKKRW